VRAVVFAYHNMGIAGLSALLRHGFEIPMVFSHADDPGENRWFGSVPDFCRERGIPVHLAEKVNEAPWPAMVREARPDYLFSFYYRSMLKEEILSAPRLAALNLHGSLLPKFRGRAPVNWVLVKGETETGVTLHVMEIKPDAGDIVGQAAVPIAFEDTAVALFGKMEAAAGALLDELLPKLFRGEIPRRRNEIEKGSYYGGRKPADGRIDWSAPALACYNLVRAVTRPYPGAFAMRDGAPLLVWRAMPLPAPPGSPAPPPGTLVPCDGTLAVVTGNGLLRLDEVEWNGKIATGAAVADLLAQTNDGRLS
jgi:UDP-4-amino-4-deoxy-L-arabinose formyltransferase/UDP-glucuronic acid dehydrogenase (UDP-4-keto-hexauronic acid decarboxylating)